MKKICLLLCLSFSICAMAQGEVTKFLGIPVDGSAREMEDKIQKKGFESVVVDTYSGQTALFGQFNGVDSYIAIQTYKDKVWRVTVVDANGTDSESQIRNRFNNLCKQFSENPRYVSVPIDQTIPEGEDIAYNMIARDKQYQALFYQAPEEGCENRSVWFMINRNDGEYRIAIHYENNLNEAHGEDL